VEPLPLLRIAAPVARHRRHHPASRRPRQHRDDARRCRGSRPERHRMTSARIATIPTPAGPFTMIATDSDLPAVLASGWTDDPALLLSVIAPALRPATLDRATAIPRITDAAIAYHDGDLAAVDGI